MKLDRWALMAFFSVLISFSTGIAEAGSGTLKGNFRYIDPTTGADQGLSSGYVYLHSATKPPPMEKFFSKADYILGPINNGAFSLSVPEGTYYLRLLRRKVVGTPARPYGPPEEGDLTWFQTAPITITAGGTTDLGTKYAASFLVAPVTLTGVVKSSGQPVAGRYVRAQSVPCTYDGYNYDVNRCGPDKYLAVQQTDSSGKFTLYLKDPGTYYLYTSTCLTTAYAQYSGNKCPATQGPVVTVNRGDKLTVNIGN